MLGHSQLPETTDPGGQMPSSGILLHPPVHIDTNMHTYTHAMEEWGGAENGGTATLISIFSLGFSKPRR